MGGSDLSNNFHKAKFERAGSVMSFENRFSHTNCAGVEAAVNVIFSDRQDRNKCYGPEK